MRYTRADVFLIPIEDLKCDPQRFQFKVIQYDRCGSTNSLKGVTRWDDLLCGSLLVWLDPVDDNIYIINGHNRYSRAVALGVKTLKCEFVTASSAVEARSIGALKNISEGNGSPLDVAKFIRDSGRSPQALIRKGKIPNTKLVQNGIAISKLTDPLFCMILDDKLSEKDAITIGLIVPTDKQNEIIPVLDKISGKALSEYCLMAVNSDQPMTQSDLFGNIEIIDNSLINRAKNIAAIRSRLSSEKRLFSTVAKNSDRLEKGNNKIDRLTSATIADCAKTALAAFDVLKLQSGKLAGLISDYQKSPGEAYKAIVEFLSDPQMIYR
jgi:hypothetical protein